MRDRREGWEDGTRTATARPSPRPRSRRPGTTRFRRHAAIGFTRTATKARNVSRGRQRHRKVSECKPAKMGDRNPPGPVQCNWMLEPGNDSLRRRQHLRRYLASEFCEEVVRSLAHPLSSEGSTLKPGHREVRLAKHVVRRLVCRRATQLREAATIEIGGDAIGPPPPGKPAGARARHIGEGAGRSMESRNPQSSRPASAKDGGGRRPT